MTESGGRAVLQPDYSGGGIVNLTSSLIRALGGEPPPLYPPASLLDGDALDEAEAVVLLVVDGLGYEYLTRRGAGGLLCRHLAGALTSVFPSTTASAITTFLTGTAPQQHGLTGWFMYFKEIGGVAAVLPFTWRGGASLRASGIEPRTLFDRPPIFDRIGVPSCLVIPKHIAGSNFNLAHTGAARVLPYGSLSQFVRAVVGAAGAGGGRRFIYTYWPEFDALAHEHGPDSRRVAVHFDQLQSAIARLVHQLRGTRTAVILTSDHGMIDSGPEHVVEVADHPSLAQSLLLPLCGERRAAYCYVQPRLADQFEAYVRTELSPYADLFSSGDLLARGYFGLGPPHPRLADRIGHYTLLMKDRYVIKDWVAGERRHVQYGVHGGVSEQEMKVPLVFFPPA